MAQKNEILKCTPNKVGLPRWLSGKESVCQRRRRVQSLGWEDPLEKEMATYSIQYSCLENPMDRGAWWAIVYGIPKTQTRLSTHTCTPNKTRIGVIHWTLELRWKQSEKIHITGETSRVDQLETQSSKDVSSSPICNAWQNPRKIFCRYRSCFDAFLFFTRTSGISVWLENDELTREMIFPVTPGTFSAFSHVIVRIHCLPSVGWVAGWEPSVLCPVVFTATLWGRCCYDPHITDGKMEAPSGNWLARGHRAWGHRSRIQTPTPLESKTWSVPCVPAPLGVSGHVPLR